MKYIAVIATGMLLAGTARAEAPEPRRPVNLQQFMGRWHEILRTPNSNETDCVSAYQDWSRADKGGISIRQHCVKADGTEKIVSTTAKVLNPPSNTKFEASFFAGLIHGRYWVIDHADDYRWMIATTEDGKYPALLARTASLPQSQQAMLKSRMSKLGFATAKLQHDSAASSAKG